MTVWHYLYKSGRLRQSYGLTNENQVKKAISLINIKFFIMPDAYFQNQTYYRGILGKHFHRKWEYQPYKKLFIEKQVYHLVTKKKITRLE